LAPTMERPAQLLPGFLVRMCDFFIGGLQWLHWVIDLQVLFWICRSNWAAA
jgi:hypothetical protein